MGGHLSAIGSTGRRSEVYRDWLRRQQEEVGVTRCAICEGLGGSWEFLGTLSSGRALLEEHRAEYHPEFRPVRRNRRMVGARPEEVEV